MKTLTFDIDKLAQLAHHAVDAPSHTFGYDLLFDPEYHKGGTIVEKDGWPDKANIDHAKVRPALLLVKDQGVYFMSNGVPELPRNADDAHVVYANEVNPRQMPFDQWYENGRSIMGGDDSVLTLFDWPEAVLKAQAEGAKQIRVKVTSNSMELEPVFERERKSPRPRG